jgi:hypothetical protein
MNRANWIGAPHYFNLNMACVAVREAFGHHLYLAGSSLEKRDFRDVDLRLILPDEKFATLFPGLHPERAGLDPLWTLMCSSISLYLSQQSGLPVDFQIQQRTAANAEEKGRRHPIGIFIERSVEALREEPGR